MADDVRARMTELRETVDSWESDPTRVEAYLRWAARFHDYSPFNKAMIYQQMPHATRCASYRSWLRAGRQVKKGEKAITIVRGFSVTPDAAPTDAPAEAPAPAPEATATEADPKGRRPRGFPVFRPSSTFDVSQTEAVGGCEDLPVLAPTPDGSEEAFAALRTRVLALAEGEGVTVTGFVGDGAAGALLDRSRTRILVSTTGGEAAATMNTLEALARVYDVDSADDVESAWVSRAVAWAYATRHDVDASAFTASHLTSYSGPTRFSAVVLRVGRVLDELGALDSGAPTAWARRFSGREALAAAS